MDEIEEQLQERDVLAYLVEHELSGPAAGIARQVMGGQRELTAPQRQVWERHISPYFRMKCKLCGVTIPTPEILAALVEEDGYCSQCRNMLSKS